MKTLLVVLPVRRRGGGAEDDDEDDDEVRWMRWMTGDMKYPRSGITVSILHCHHQPHNSSILH
jgi:hypothetical protein